MNIKSKEIKMDLVRMVDYLWHDEKKHYTEGPSRKHIYLSVRRIAKAVGYKPNF